MEKDSMDRVIATILRIPPTIHSKILRETFSKAIHQAEFGLAHHYVMIMNILQESGTLSSSEIGAITSISKAQMTHSVKKLVMMGLIEKHSDANDRRKFNLRLTPKGHATNQSIDENIANLFRERLSSLSEEELMKLTISHENIAEIFLKLK